MSPRTFRRIDGPPRKIANHAGQIPRCPTILPDPRSQRHSSGAFLSAKKNGKNALSRSLASH